MIGRKGKTTARGYGRQHQRRRAELAPYVAAGLVDCWRCEQRIRPGQPWDLGHDDSDRTRYRGAEHQACNRGAPGKRRADPAPRPRTRW
jgi:hypothetical protein